MKTLSITLAIITALLAGYYGYSSYQQQIALQQSLAQHQLEQQALQQAQQSKDLSQLNRFIADYPESEWIERAIYERDKLAYHQAVEKNQIEALQSFISQYANSQWIPQARNRLQRLQQEQKLLADIEKKQQQLEIQRQQVVIQQQQAAAEQQQSEEKQAPEKIKTSLSSRDRVAKALAIYQKQRQQEQQEENEQQQQQIREEKLQQKCIQIKDQIEQYRQRIRWYDLDKNGKRIYLSKQQVENNRQSLQRQYQENCQ